MNDLKGQIVVIDFWGSWCGWCIKGFPDWNKMIEEYKGQPIMFVGLSTDGPSKKELWKRILEKNKVKGLQLSCIDEERTLFREFGVKSYPNYLILDKQGRIYKWNAPKLKYTKLWGKLLNELLAEE